MGGRSTRRPAGNPFVPATAVYPEAASGLRPAGVFVLVALALACCSDNDRGSRSGSGIGIDKESVGMPANMERKPPTSITANEQLTKSNDSALVGANGVKENVTNGSSKGVTSTSGAAAKGGDNPSTAAASAEAADAAEAKASSSPSQVQKKKRKAPGPILVRAGGGVGGGRKKKRGKITIGKAS